MFRDDTLTVKRETYEVIENEAIKTFETVFDNIPCHLSINLTNTIHIQNVPYLNSEFTLFLNYDPNIKIKENDFLIVNTSKNQIYELFAGEIKVYNFSIQIKCRQNKIIES